MELTTKDIEKIFKQGADTFKEHVLRVLKENKTACKNLTIEDKIRSAQDIVNETYDDLVSIVENLNMEAVEASIST